MCITGGNETWTNAVGGWWAAVSHPQAITQDPPPQTKCSVGFLFLVVVSILVCSNAQYPVAVLAQAEGGGQILKIPVSFCSKNVVHRRLRVRRTHPHTFVLQGGATTPRPRARRLQSDLTARKHLEQTTCSAGSSVREWITPSPRHCCDPRVLCMDYSGLQITGQPYATTGTCVCGVLVGDRPIPRWLRR